MAKKKKPEDAKAAKNEAYTAKLEEKLNLMVEENERLEAELGTKQQAIKELTDESEDTSGEMADLENTITSLKEQLVADKGLPPDPTPEIQELSQQLKQFKQANEALQVELSAAKNSSVVEVATGAGDSWSVSSNLLDVTPDKFQLIAACVGKVIDRDGNPYDQKNFDHMLQTLVEQGTQLANAIVNSSNPVEETPEEPTEG